MSSRRIAVSHRLSPQPKLGFRSSHFVDGTPALNVLSTGDLNPFPAVILTEGFTSSYLVIPSDERSEESRDLLFRCERGPLSPAVNYPPRLFT